MIYCIGNRIQGICKIGYTGRPIELRLAALQTGNPYPLTVLAVRDGNQINEAMLHVKHRKHRMAGEWFKICQEIAEDFGFELLLPQKFWAVAMTFLSTDTFPQIRTKTGVTVIAPTEHEALIEAQQKMQGSGMLIEKQLVEIPNDMLVEAYTTIIVQHQQI